MRLHKIENNGGQSQWPQPALQTDDDDDGDHSTKYEALIGAHFSALYTA